MGTNISRHNSKILNKDEPTKITTGCNCQKSRVCPMPGQCMAEGVIYGATVKETICGKIETYTGLSDPPFKKRYGGHLSTFKHKNSDHTSLSNHSWDLKRKSIDHTISWKILARSKGFNPSTGQCRLCIKEKYFFMFNPSEASLNNRTEFYSSCRHIAKHLMGGKT